MLALYGALGGAVLAVVTQAGFAISRAWARSRAASRLEADRLRNEMEMGDRGSVSSVGQVTYFTDGSRDWTNFDDEGVERLAASKQPNKNVAGPAPKKQDDGVEGATGPKQSSKNAAGLAGKKQDLNGK